VSKDSTASFASAIQGAAAEAQACLILVAQSGRPLPVPLVFPLWNVREVSLSRSPSRDTSARVEGGALLLELADGWMSAPHARLMREPAGDWRLHDPGSKNGSYLNGARVSSALLDDGDLIDLGFSFLSLQLQLPQALVAELQLAQAKSEPVTTLCPALHGALAELDRIAESKLAVMLSGETGTGKELAARRVHAASGRRGPFIAVNCAAIAGSVAESELFGFVKGSFTGASEDRQGLLRAAHGGTLFLDEVAELDPAIQSKLLRALQQEEVLPVGSTRPVRVDLRVISASCRDLAALVESGQFREDLFARLAGHRVTLPPLRERREDLCLLVAALLRESLQDRAGEVRLQREVLRALYRYDWPRNIRQLKHALEAAVALSDGLELRLEHLPAELRRQPHEPKPAPASSEDEPLRAQLAQLLLEHRGNISAVARALGKERVQIRRWCRRWALDPETFRS
jgi:transcriptional regulator with PAS, ATPase and Fis domain